jgi:hypothetical protein
MKSAINDDTLTAFALEFGVPVELDGGRVFNSQGLRMSPAARKPGASSSTSTTQTRPASAASSDALLERVAELVARPVQVQVSLPSPPMAKVLINQAPVATPVGWVFEFERNNDGTIARIRALPDGG